MKKQLIISTSIDLVRIAPDRIVYIASDGNYSTHEFLLIRMLLIQCSRLLIA